MGGRGGGDPVRAALVGTGETPQRPSRLAVEGFIFSQVVTNL